MYLSNLQQDEIFVPSEMKSLKSLTQMESRRGLENTIISNGKIVNVVSNSYGHVPNELFFKKAEEMLTDAGLNYQKRTINRNDRSFITDFIIDDKSQFSVKNEKDLILPMLRFKNSYDGSEKTSGHFGFYRQVCSNGLHVSQAEIEFSIKHSKNNTDLIMPRLNNLFDKFVDNEFYSITKKFDRMREFEIIDTKEFVKEILESTRLFRYECSDRNNDPSKKSREVLEILDNEALLLNEVPNLWIGYNAFNQMLHNTLKKSFSQQERLDKKLFDAVYEMA
ncbi:MULTISPECIES: DUF932 domain-containing protein [Flavobacteriaceae]|uniref:DUF932 domain-containing protein n=3 Tax=Leeuwenhoekiella TaxID=283735 RepID=A0A4Q0PE87_9FLAO|nr:MULTISPECIES: DUF932 domain-containing protein [Flavobacteriaceae]MAY89193.1 DUF932 domain-containing protein [Pseudooceanicola sp.]RXG11779.1 putative protein DUF932 [Leeuwenhoekiella polynyae]RXG25071.1 putative protein DUF932 [Leeuwenhoekiella marinoflava]SHF89913.1 protein of unknown function [Leeuwenhoekiella marinoflava DSM 3653]